jgi:hypothetical protein
MRTVAEDVPRRPRALSRIEDVERIERDQRRVSRTAGMAQLQDFLFAA